MVTMPWFVVFELLAPFVEVFGLAFLAVALVLMSADALGLTHLQLVDQDVIRVLLATASIFYAVRAHPGRAAGRGDLVPPLPGAAGPGDRGLGVAGGEHRLPAAQRVVADGRRHRGLARDGQHDWGDMQRRGLGKT